jgi:hypothetical protein
MTHRALWQVLAGADLGEPDPQFTREFTISDTDYERDRTAVVTQRFHQAVAYASELQMHAVANRRTLWWVRITFFWLGT